MNASKGKTIADLTSIGFPGVLTQPKRSSHHLHNNTLYGESCGPSYNRQRLRKQECREICVYFMCKVKKIICAKCWKPYIYEILVINILSLPVYKVVIS